MHISTPTQILPAGGLLQGDAPAANAAEDSPFFAQSALRKSQPGVFAELLEALSRKAKGQPLPGEEAPPEEAFPGAEETGENSLFWQVPGHSSQAAGAHDPHDQMRAHGSGELPASAESFDGEGMLGGLSGFFRQDMLLEEQGQGGQIQAAPANYSGHMNPNEESALELLAKKPGETPDFGPLSSRFETGALQSAKNAGEGREKRVRSWGAEGLFAGTAKAEPPAQAMYHPDFVSTPSGDAEKALVSELRDRTGGRDQFSIDVRDLRSAEERNAAAGAVSAEAHKSAGFDAAHAEVGITVNLKPSPQLGDGWTARKTGREFSQSRIFEDALARELRGNLSADIVKNASLVIRNGGEGTIRLALNPASLGHVKVHLEMTENKIMGHIIVESSEALRAFQRELSALERAFRDSGFLETSLDMSLAQDGREFGTEQRQDRELPALDAALAASRYDAGTEPAELAEGMSDSGKTLLPASPERKTVNLFV